MFDFDFYNPTKIIFGKGRISEISSEIPKDNKVLIAYGGGSIKENGVLNQVTKALKGYETIEFGGIEPNPVFETLMQAVEIVRKENIDFILAVGGGSVIDGVKFIAAAAPFEGDEWDILAKSAPISEAIPFGTVLTLPATGSEMNSGAVISNKALQDKLTFHSPLVFPKFSALAPTTSYTLPARQISNGVVDAFVHIIEQYLTYPVNAKVQDRFCEGLLLSLIEEGPKALENPKDYDVRANIMWCATMALNGLIGAGVPQDWTTHRIGHEITAMHGLDHAQTLAIILPSLLDICKDEKREKLIQYAERVWGAKDLDEDAKVELAINKTRDFFEDMQVKTHLRDYNIDNESFPRIIEKLKDHGLTKLGEKGNITLSVSERILERSL
jgi:NADP-dependent alcohol dehydrogenase